MKMDSKATEMSKKMYEDIITATDDIETRLSIVASCVCALAVHHMLYERFIDNDRFIKSYLTFIEDGIRTGLKQLQDSKEDKDD